MHDLLSNTRRDFLTTSACGLGAAGLGALLADDGVLAADSSTNPLAVKPSHFEPRAKACIFIFMAGAPSHLDLFDPKPRLNELHQQPLPAEQLKDVRFAFIKKDSVRLMGSKRKFTPYGESGIEFSDFLPHIGGCADDLLLVRSLYSQQFNHHPGQLLMQCGRGTFGLPTMGSWFSYGLGSQSNDLPGYVVLTSGRGSSGLP